MRHILVLLFWLVQALTVSAETLTRAEIEPFIIPPYALGEPVNDKGVWSLRNSGGAEAGYVFETAPMAPLPGFSGAPINMLVMLDLDGRFLDVRLIAHNEPIFVSGLGEAPFRKFMEQYRGQSINTPMVVGTPYGDGGAGSGLVYLEGVAKATASVRIAHESILAATLQVAREKMQGIQSAPPAHPDPAHDEPLDWQALVDQGIARNLRVSNAELDQAFAGTVWADDDAEAQADPDGVYLDLWLVDIGPPSIARAVLDDEAFADLQRFMAVSSFDEPFLLIDAGRHGLVSADFVRNTAPDLLGAEQDGLPIALRDADMIFGTRPDVPEGTAMILRTDRRLGFDPARDWLLQVKAVREHGMFQPEVGSATFTLTHATPERFYARAGVVEVLPPWREAIRNRQTDLMVLAIALPALLLLLGPGMDRLAAARHFTAIRLAILAIVTGFVGWWGQGQLSIVTPLAVLRTAWEGGSFAYLLYDPVSLLIWAATILGFVLWGRGLFCGWLCPFGALQEFAHHLGRLLRLPQWDPPPLWDARLKGLKYLLLAGLVLTVFVAPDQVDTVVEVEPFKTAITTFFLRDWVFVAYAAGWLLLGMVTFKGFCRYVCPLGALMAIGGLLRGRDWIARRKECGSPCQLCRVRCKYGAIKPSGQISYSECFQCLDCVTIHNDAAQCVPLILAAKGRPMRAAAK
ncbi:4Fe-4S binding protein (plasmid) [Gemmobacter fulvus]|uniref:4Fe-4S binding protein n=1 Tax=Gemmobacter fulvus TaxID=2840474 RepID=A0A975PAI7_9RHOB|nr:4Fe-4S binding protein [Gemmobacter fulvus]MBT9246580.1 4Fe-4S binding protein [Gemmobacter fulvus]QWK92669.1 4Fe-4S binding protein [Gemmobacter fulvus]